MGRSCRCAACATAARPHAGGLRSTWPARTATRIPSCPPAASLAPPRRPWTAPATFISPALTSDPTAAGLTTRPAPTSTPDGLPEATTKVLTWLADRLAHLLPPRPPGQSGTPPLPLKVRLDAVAAVLLDGLSYRRAGRAVGISKTEVGESLDLLLGPLAALGYCQPDGSFITTLAKLREHLAEMAQTGEAVCLDGLGTRVQRPRSWVNQKVLYDAKRHTHTAQGLALSTIWGDLLWCDGGWPGCCHEQELIELAGLDAVLDASGVATIIDRGFRGMAKPREHWHAPVGDRRTKDRP